MITYRLNSIKQKTILVQERTKDILTIVQEKNAPLLSEIYKGANANANTSKVKMGNISLQNTT